MGLRVTYAGLTPDLLILRGTLAASILISHAGFAMQGHGLCRRYGMRDLLWMHAELYAGFALWTSHMYLLLPSSKIIVGANRHLAEFVLDTHGRL